jgi:hypothetical protein
MLAWGLGQEKRENSKKDSMKGRIETRKAALVSKAVGSTVRSMVSSILRIVTSPGL